MLFRTTRLTPAVVNRHALGAAAKKRGNGTAKLISSGAYYIHKVKSKSYMDGLHFERIGEGLDYHGE